MKKDAEYYVGVFCDYLTVADLNDEIARTAPHILCRLVEHLGEIPQGSGYYHETLSGKVDKMRSIHSDFTQARRLMMLLTHAQYRAVFYWQYYLNSRPEGAEKLLKTGKDIAAYMKCDYKAFRQARYQGLDRMNAELGILVA